MACLLVPAAEAVVTTLAARAAASRENEFAAEEAVSSKKSGQERAPFARKLKWLSNLLWGGSALLAFEHVWHGEITPWFPFLTAAGNPQDTAVMLHELSTVGVSMAVLVTAVWGCMVLVTGAMERKAISGEAGQNA